MTEQNAYRSTDPAVVAAYRAAKDRREEFTAALNASLAEIGKNKGARARTSRWTDETIDGLAPVDRDDPPAGWQFLKSWGCLRPRKGKAGAGARAWLEAHQPPPSPRSVMVEHGLPRCSRAAGYPEGLGNGLPSIGLHGDAVWVLYSGVPDGDVGGQWEPIPLSEFYAAKEAAAAREEETAGA